MTTEDKAKAYDEALKKAKEIKSKILSSHLSTESCKAISEYIDEIIPELAESEDERIRKKLVEYHKQQFEKNRDQEIGLFHKDALTYLEKQREEEGYDAIPVESTLEYKLGFKAGKDSEKQKEQKDNTVGTVSYGNNKPSQLDMAISIEETKRFLEKGKKQKEPFPVPDKFSGLKSLMLQYLQSAANRKNDSEIESDTDLWGRKILDYVWKYSDEQKPIIQDVELNDAVYDYVRDHFIAGADFTPEYIKKLMENAFFAGVDYYLLKQESESCESDTNVEKVIEDVIRVYGKTQGEWVGGYDIDALIVNLRRAFNKKEQKPAEWSEKHIADIFEKVGLAKIVREQGNDELTNALQDAMLELSKLM